MKKNWGEFLILVLVIIFIPTTINAQLFEKEELYPDTKIIKGKYYNSSVGRGWWSLEYVDSIGRVFKKENYGKKRLISTLKIKYDYNNKILGINEVYYNNQNREDTFKYEYKYSGNMIMYQFQKLSINLSSVIELIENQMDTLLKYQEKTTYYNPKTKDLLVFETIYTLKFKNGLLVSNEAYDKKENSRKIKQYEYFDNGRLKRRVIENIPEPEFKSAYIGGPGSDDESYKYELDSKGRIVKYYKIINNKEYKIATYKYK